jgi:hypothetical protein
MPGMWKDTIRAEFVLRFGSKVLYCHPDLVNNQIRACSVLLGYLKPAVHRSIVNPTWFDLRLGRNKRPSQLPATNLSAPCALFPFSFMPHIPSLVPYAYIITVFPCLRVRTQPRGEFPSILSQQPFQILVSGFQLSHLLHHALQLLRCAQLAHIVQLRHKIVHLCIDATRGIATALL